MSLFTTKFWAGEDRLPASLVFVSKESAPHAGKTL